MYLPLVIMRLLDHGVLSEQIFSLRDLPALSSVQLIVHERDPGDVPHFPV